jgi:N-acyl-D-aspartate/D-glutamate deacylase
MADALVRWSWQTFGEHPDAVDFGSGVNMLPLVGHHPLRLEAMAVRSCWTTARTRTRSPVACSGPAVKHGQISAGEAGTGTSSRARG